MATARRLHEGRGAWAVLSPRPVSGLADRRRAARGEGDPPSLSYLPHDRIA